VLRVNAPPQDAPYTEFLTYGFDERRPQSAVAYLQWEKKRVSLKIDVPDVNDIYVAEIRRELLAWPGFNWQNWQNAAQFCAQKKINLDEALVWADRAIKEPFRNATQGQEDFSTYQTKASVLEAMGRIPEADATMDKAFGLPGADLIPVYIYGVTVFRAGRAKKSVEIFERNLKLHPDDRFWNYVGLARAHTALGEKAKAIREWETALAHVPESRKFQIPAFEASLKKLKET
jgi:tetratricopeptide (TPR) repeat protein